MIHLLISYPIRVIHLLVSFVLLKYETIKNCKNKSKNKSKNNFWKKFKKFLNS